ncbi:hypothetical protein A2767_01580 [Candidatus Roizmanbacteria bacterium RIFCSPHIGHO2_01_FULL_35_10]|uniref:Uncharacterized protein n=1 Tax=Candidatus Roizmanbacteria bacterium RIFCSPLOWO2_01_FULL_35_13 TaxID=1802055 RepID=A0A1F7IAR5_9BACT|nr:MAG: hypothetical protein A2767_01580 [Candidatus Roizmanbacteria bacterium RIFCSPHIGHO2_01_FULL_35_10]OGK40430.1 MAG: hypothetical protein A3A74_01860 [Candidatus Roizmanbacteria bacterium RIFCSPLOWO2_01_FULL_35_13]
MAELNELMTLEQMIKGYMGDLVRIQEKIKTQKEMFKQSFEQDKDYSKAEEEAKELIRKKTEQKQRIVKTDAVSAVQMKIDELQTELKEARQSLSDYLNRYILLTQKSEFLGPDGEAYQIVRSAKLVKKK